MKRFSIIFTIAILIATLGNIDTIAQEEQNGQLWFCWEVTVKPARLNDFIELQVEFRTHFREANFSYPVSAWTDGNFHYYFFYPVKDYNEKDDIYAAYWNVADLWGMDRMSKMWETVESRSTSYIRHLPDFSYVPENPRLKKGETIYAMWDMMFVIPAKDAEFRQTAKKFIAMLKSADFGDAVNLMIGDVGYETNAYLWTLYGKSPADFWTENEKLWDGLGDEGQKLNKEALSLLRKREFKQFWYSEKLSYSPEE